MILLKREVDMMGKKTKEENYRAWAFCVVTGQEEVE